MRKSHQLVVRLAVRYLRMADRDKDLNDHLATGWRVELGRDSGALLRRLFHDPLAADASSAFG